jgi:hypothetical protein
MGSTLTVDNIRGATSSSSIHIPGHVVQVVQGFDNTQANTNNSTDTEALTGLRTSITPTSTSSKILVTINYHVVTVASSSHSTVFVKRSTDGGSSFSNLSNYLQGTGNEAHRNASTVGYFGQHTHVILDSPATTSTCIYNIFMRTNGSNIRLNDNGAGTRIILQEIAQ